MELTAYLYTNPGGRKENEDCANFRIQGPRGLFALADGLGGHRNGAEASSLAVETMMKLWSDPPGENAEGPRRLEQAIMRANDRLLLAAGGKSTAVLLEIDGTWATWAHVGDSRLYVLNGGLLYRGTEDHSVSYKKYRAGDIALRDVNFDEDRPSLLRVLGDEERCKPESQTLAGLGTSLRPGDGFLLCSDGFWEYIYDEEILIDFLKSASPEEWVKLLLLRLLVRIGPHSDNLTALAVMAQ